jgi:hypothetical protein
MNVEIGTETPIFLLGEYLFQNFGILSLQCTEKRKGERWAFSMCLLRECRRWVGGDEPILMKAKNPGLLN